MASYHFGVRKRIHGGGQASEKLMLVTKQRRTVLLYICLPENGAE